MVYRQTGLVQKGFITLSQIILEQQVSLASAQAHFNKLNSYVKEFNPKYISKLTDEEMRLCQISRQKSRYLKELASALTTKKLDLDHLHTLSDDDIRISLTQIKGIGNWTVDVYLMFCMQSKNIFPIGDIALINSVKELTALQTQEEILKRAEKWKPYRTLATYFLWHYYLKKRGRSQVVD